MILYNDPEENVDLSKAQPVSNDTFPFSWYLPPSGVERGGTSLHKGDPLTQGFPAKGINNRVDNCYRAAQSQGRLPR